MKKLENLFEEYKKLSFHKKVLQVICIFLIVTNLVIFTFYRNEVARHVVSDYEAKYSLIDSHRQFHQSEDMIVNIQELREYLKLLPEQNKDWAELSIYFEVLNTGANVSVNPDLKIWPASLAKLPIAMVAMKKVEKGEWSLDTFFELKKEDIDQDSVLVEVGKKYTLKEIINSMLYLSDNSSWKILSRSLSDQEVMDIGNAVGLDELFVKDAKVSAKEYARLYRALYLAVYLNEENSQLLLDILTKNSFKDFLRSGLPKDFLFAQKWGTNTIVNAYSDSGIIYIEERPYILVVMLQSKLDDVKLSREKANQLMKEISERSYNFMSKNN